MQIPIYEAGEEAFGRGLPMTHAEGAAWAAPGRAAAAVAAHGQAGGAQLTDMALAFEDKARQAADAVEVASLQADAVTQLDAASAALREKPDWRTHVPTWQQNSAAILQGVADRASNPRVQQQLALRFPALAAKFLAQERGFARQAMVSTERATITDTTETYIGAAVRDSVPGMEGIWHGEIQSLLTRAEQSGIVTPVEREHATREAWDRIVRGRAERLMVLDPSNVALQAYKQEGLFKTVKPETAIHIFQAASQEAHRQDLMRDRADTEQVKLIRAGQKQVRLDYDARIALSADADLDALSMEIFRVAREPRSFNGIMGFGLDTEDVDHLQTRIREMRERRQKESVTQPVDEVANARLWAQVRDLRTTLTPSDISDTYLGGGVITNAAEMRELQSALAGTLRFRESEKNQYTRQAWTTIAESLRLALRPELSKLDRATAEKAQADALRELGQRVQTGEDPYKIRDEIERKYQERLGRATDAAQRALEDQLLPYTKFPDPYRALGQDKEKLGPERYLELLNLLNERTRRHGTTPPAKQKKPTGLLPGVRE